MKRMFFALLCIALIVGMQSCKAAPEGATLRIEMDKGVRTISPERDSMEIYGYRVITTGPDGKENAPRYTYYSYINLDSLTVGVWKIQVYGFNKERTDICYGEEEVSLNAGKNSVIVRVNQLVGNGNLTIKLNWDKEAFPTGKSVQLKLTAQDGQDIAVTPSNPTGESTTVTKENLPTGSYTLSAKLLDGEGNALSGVTEAIRINNGATTSGTITFVSETTGEIGDGKIEISNNTSLPIEVSVNGLESLMEEDTPFTLNVSLPENSKVTLDTLDTFWYLDGNYIGKGNEFTFKDGVNGGIHRLDVVTQTTDKGSMGSVSLVFQAAPATNEGDPYQKYTMEDGSKWKLGGNVVIHFIPDGRILIVSNQYKTIQLVKIKESKPELECEYTFDDLGIDGQVADFSSFGEEDDGFWSLIFLVNTDYNCKALNIMVSKNTLTKCDEVTDFDPYGKENKANRFINIVPNRNTFVASIENNDKSRMGIVIFNRNSQKGEMVLRDDWYTINTYIEWGKTGYKHMASIPNNGFTIVTTSQRSKIFRFIPHNTGVGIREYMMWHSYDDFMNYYNQGKCKAEFENAHSCGFLTQNGEYAFVFSTEGIHYYKDCSDDGEEYAEYYVESLKDRAIGDIKMCPDTEYGYMLDNDSKKLYTMRSVFDSGKGGYILQEGSSINYGSRSADTIEISLSGDLLAIFDSHDTRCITLVKTAR